MSSTNLSQSAGVYKLDNFEPTESMEETSTSSEDVMANRLLVVCVDGHCSVINSEQLKTLAGDHQVICYADSDTGSLNKMNGEQIKKLDQSSIEEFLDGMATALNLVESEKHNKTEAPKTANKLSGPLADAGISEARDQLSSELVQTAIKKALKLVSSSMEQNIERWSIEAGDRLSGSAMTSGSDPQRARSIAYQLQNSSQDLAKRFQTRLIECLHKFNHPEKEQIELSNHNLSLAEDGEWHKHTAILTLASKVSGQTKLDFNQLNRRFSYLLNKRIKPEKNVIGPEMMAWCICSAVDDISLNKEQVDELQSVISELFAGALGKIYREINMLWIGMDIIPQIKLRVWQDDYQSRDR